MTISKDTTIDITGCSFNGIPIEEELKTQKTKEIQSVYSDEIKGKKDPNPIATKPKYKLKKERNGKVMTITNLIINESVLHNYKKCKTLKDVVLCLLLGGCEHDREYTVIQMYTVIEEDAKIYNEVNMSIGKTFTPKSISNVMSRLKRSGLSKFLEINKVITSSGKEAYSYFLTPEGRNLSFEEASLISKEWPRGTRPKKKLSKQKIRKAVKDQKLSKNVQEIIKAQLERMMADFLSKVGEILQKEYQKGLENMHGEIISLQEKVNELHLHSQPTSPIFTIKVDIPHNFVISLIKGTE